MTFLDLLKGFKAEDKVIHLTFGEKFYLNCKITEIHADFVKVNLHAFNKSERQYITTSNNAFVPIGSIVYIEEAGQ